MQVVKIISGGQTGVDRAGLDWAIENGVCHGGWCPHGRRAEDGTIPARYNLLETSQKDYRARTKLNVRDSDGTVVVTPGDELAGGSLLTARAAEELGRPLLHLAVSTRTDEAGERLRLFIDNNRIRVLNVAGCRLSKSAAAADFTLKILDLALY